MQRPLVAVARLLPFKPMRIASWNVNSLKARLHHVLDYCRAETADVLLLQELKLSDKNVPREAFADIGWNIETHGQKTYNGVAVLSKKPIEIMRRSLPNEPSIAEDGSLQARYIEADIEGVRLASIYLPNGNPNPGPKFAYKIAWMKALNAHAADLLDTERPVVLAGDYNVIPQDIDCYDPQAWQGDALTDPQSRAAFFALSHMGYTDALRAIHPQGAHYSFWDYQAGAWQKDNGIRIDHLMLSPEAANKLVFAGVDKAPRGLEKPSDHTPVWCELDSK